MARVAMIVIVMLAGCASRPPGVILSDDWPSQAPAYADAHHAWTRHAVLRDGYDQVMEVYATFKSPQWRAAHVNNVARTGRLTAEARQRLAEAQAEAHRNAYEVELLVTTQDHSENDLNKGERSIWKLTLRDDRGNAVEPISVQRDRRPRQVLRAEYPNLGDFAVPYVVRFPRTIDVLRPDATQLSLTMASLRGSVELVWSRR